MKTKIECEQYCLVLCLVRVCAGWVGGGGGWMRSGSCTSFSAAEQPLNFVACYVRMFTSITDCKMTCKCNCLLNFERHRLFTDSWFAVHTHFSQSHHQNDQQQTTLELHQLPEHKNSVFHHPNPHLIKKTITQNIIKNSLTEGEYSFYFPQTFCHRYINAPCPSSQCLQLSPSKAANI